MAAVVTSVNLHSTLKLTDVRFRKHLPPLTWTFTKHLKGGDSDNRSFSWDDVAVGVSEPDQRLVSDFGTVHFTRVKVNGAVIGSFDPNFWQVNWVDNYGNAVAKTSPLGSGGGSFTVTWKRGK